jgi:hypothetical protein
VAQLAAKFGSVLRLFRAITQGNPTKFGGRFGAACLIGNNFAYWHRVRAAAGALIRGLLAALIAHHPVLHVMVYITTAPSALSGGGGVSAHQASLARRLCGCQKI